MCVVEFHTGPHFIRPRSRCERRSSRT
jgi:hypothetical protein